MGGQRSRNLCFAAHRFFIVNADNGRWGLFPWQTEPERDIYWTHSFPLCHALILEQKEREASEKEKGTGAGLMIDAAASAAWLLMLKAEP